MSNTASAATAWQQLLPNSNSNKATIPQANALTRHAILAALLHTRFHPDTLTHRKTVYPPALLQAVASQVPVLVLEQQGLDVALQEKGPGKKKNTNNKTSNNKNNNKNNITLVHCSIAAVTCLSNYVAFAPEQNSNFNTNCSSSDDEQQTTANWFFLFVRRLHDCWEAIASMENARDADPPHQPQQQQQQQLVWLELTEQCLWAMVHLLEQNPTTCELLLLPPDETSSSTLPSSQSTTKSSTLSVWQHTLTQWLKFSATQCATTTTHPRMGTSAKEVDTDDRRLWHSIRTLTVRCLHTAWDDNPDLVLPMIRQQQPYNGQGGGGAMETLECLRDSLLVSLPNASHDSDNESNPSASSLRVAQLHAVGAWMSVWLVVQDDKRRENRNGDESGDTATTTSNALCSILDSQVCACLQRLRQVLVDDNVPAAAAAAAVRTYETTSTDASSAAPTVSTTASSTTTTTVTWQVWSERLRLAELENDAEQADDAMEQTVLLDQHAKQEPARHIARRLHPRPNHKTNDSSTDAAASATPLSLEEIPSNKDDESNDILAGDLGTTKTSRSVKHVKDACAQWETAQVEWHDTIRPLQLALELLVNWTSSEPSDDDIHEMDDDSDDDVVMNDVSTSALSSELTEKMLESRLPDTAYQVFVLLSDWWNHRSRSCSVSSDGVFPAHELVQASVSDCLSKSAAAIGHCLANISTWQISSKTSSMEEDVMGVKWSAFMNHISAANNSMNFDEGDNVNDNVDTGTDEHAISVLESVTSTMVFALRCRKSILDQVEADDVSHLILCLRWTSRSNPLVARNIIAMLGILAGPDTEICTSAIRNTISEALIGASTPHEAAKAASRIPASNESSQQHPSAMLLSEALNVLMDIYGDDDDDTDTSFDALGVLFHFQRSVPLLKQRIAVEQLTKNSSEDDLESWKECSMNAARFIQYKKGFAS